MGIISNLMFAIGFRMSDRAITRAEKEMNKLKKTVDEAGSSLERTERAASGVTSAFMGISSGAGVFGGIQTSAMGLAVTLNGLAAAAMLFKKALSGAMEMEQTQMQIEALAGSAEKGKAIFEMINAMGLKSVFSEKDFLNAGKAYLPITKDLGELNKMLSITERLASANPLEGMEGAAFAIRELTSGDITSIAERFNIGKGDLRAAGFDSAKDYKNNIAALNTVLNKYGYTQDYINKVNQSGAAQWDMLQSNIGMAISKSGTKALNLLKKPLEDMNKWMSSGGLDALSNGLSNAMAGTVNFAVTAGRGIIRFVSETKPAIQMIGAALSTAFGNAVAVGKDLWVTLEPLATLVGTALTNAFKALWPDIKAGYTALEGIRQSFVGWEGFSPMVLGIAAAFGAYKTALLISTLQTTALATATKIYMGAQAALNVVMSLNPLGLVVAGLVGLGVALFLAYKKSEKFRAVVDGVWEGVKAGFLATVNWFATTLPAWVSSVIGWFGGVWDGVTGIWNRITTYFQSINLFDVGKNIIQGLVDGVGSMASSVVEQARAIGSSIKDAITGFLDIHSPSRVMMEIGFFTGQGLARGIEGTAKLVSRVSAKLAEAAAIPYDEAPALSPARYSPSSTDSAAAASVSVIRIELAPIQVEITGPGAGTQIGREIGAGLGQALVEVVQSASRILRGPSEATG